MSRRESFSRRGHEMGEVGRKEERKNRKLLRRALTEAQDLNPSDDVVKPTIVSPEQPTS